MTEAHQETALKRGRPTGACDCETCDCELHTYPEDSRCIWCQNGDHSSAETQPENLIEKCIDCGTPINANEEGYYKSTDERFVHKVCFEEDDPDRLVLDLTDEFPFEEHIPKTYNCGHYADGPPRRLPAQCPECEVSAP